MAWYEEGLRYSLDVPVGADAGRWDGASWVGVDETGSEGVSSSGAVGVPIFQGVPRTGDLGQESGQASDARREAIRAQVDVRSRINPSYDVEPDVINSVAAAANAEFSSSIYALRRATLVNPGGVVGVETPLGSRLAGDPELAQRVRYARSVYMNPPLRVVSEADGHFMVAALSAALGELDTARNAVTAARAAGDSSVSTDLLGRVLAGEDLPRPVAPVGRRIFHQP